MSDDFAVIKLNSKQFLVSEGDQFKIDRIDPNSTVEVLLSSIGENLLIGEPNVSEICVVVEVIEDLKDKKVEVRRYKSKSRYRKNKSHRQPISVVKILSIRKGKKSEIRVSKISSNDIKETEKKISEKDNVKQNGSNKKMVKKVSEKKQAKSEILKSDSKKL